jgi:hypothetical protein
MMIISHRLSIIGDRMAIGIDRMTIGGHGWRSITTGIDRSSMTDRG